MHAARVGGSHSAALGLSHEVKNSPLSEVNCAVCRGKPGPCHFYGVFLLVQFLYCSALSLPITCRPSATCFTPAPRGTELSSPSWWENGLLLSTAFHVRAQRKQTHGELMG